MPLEKLAWAHRKDQRCFLHLSSEARPASVGGCSVVSWNDAMEFCKKLTERERAAGRLSEGVASVRRSLDFPYNLKETLTPPGLTNYAAQFG